MKRKCTRLVSSRVVLTSVRDALLPDPALAEKVIGAQTLAQTPVFVAERLEVQTADGARAPRFIARHHGGVGVVAVREGSVCLVRQYRCALGRVTLEIPAGGLEPGEEPHAAAARELAEETGLVASDLRHLVRVYGSPGFTDEKTDVFLATGLAQGPACPDEGEFLRVAWLPATDVVRAVLAGAIQDSKTVCGVLAARAAGVLE